MIEIRPYSAADSGPLLDLARELQGFEAVLYERMKPVSDIGPWYLDLLKQYCQKDDGTILMAWESGRAIGYATIFTNVVEDGSREELPHSLAKVGDLVVTETARGRGIARKLLEECERLARIAGRDEIRISVLARNSHAHDVYWGAGFEDHHISMRKKLSP